MFRSCRAYFEEVSGQGLRFSSSCGTRVKKTNFSLMLHCTIFSSRLSVQNIASHDYNCDIVSKFCNSVLTFYSRNCHCKSSCVLSPLHDSNNFLLTSLQLIFLLFFKDSETIAIIHCYLQIMEQ